jgi:nucleotide-binding universal stress UspA family protein
MSEHIVVGVDGSDGAAEALRWAVRERQAREAELTAVLVWASLHQLRAGAGEAVDGGPDDADALAVLRTAVARILTDVPPGLRLRVVNDLPGPGLVHAAADADLLVVGARGLGGFKGLLLGSVSHHCLHHAPCPVAVVKAGVDGRDVNRIVVGTDGSATSQRALAWAIGAARAHGAAVRVVHAWHPVVMPMDAYLMTGADLVEEAARALLDDAVAQQAQDGLVTPLEPVLVLDSPGKAVLDHAADADLVVVGSRQRSAAGCLFLGSTSLQVTQHAPCPVVVVPPGS